MEKITFKNMGTETSDKAVAWALEEIKYYIGHTVGYGGPLTIGSSMRYEREYDPDLPFAGPTTIIGFDIHEGQIDPEIFDRYVSEIRKRPKIKDGYRIAGAAQSSDSDNWYYLYVVVRKNTLSFNCVEEN